MGAPGTTEGPWVLDHHGTVWAHGDGVNDGVCIVCDVFDGNPARNSRLSEMATANRHQIAASSAMYDMLVAAADFVQPFNSSQALLEEIEAVLALARGES